MKKYKVVKWLVLFTAIFAVVCFFTPFAYRHSYAFGEFGIIYGFNFIIGESSHLTIVSVDNWLVRISLIISVVAVVVAVLPFVSKNRNGLNKQNKIHKSIIVSLALSLSSALLNFISMLVGVCTEISESGHTYNPYQEFYTFIGLIPIAIVAIIVVILFVRFKPELAYIKDTPQPEAIVENKVVDTVVIPKVSQPEIIESVSSATSVNESSSSSKPTVDSSEQPNNTELTAEKEVAETVTISATNQPEIIESATVETNASSVSGQSLAKVADQQAKTVFKAEITDSEVTYSDDGKTLLKIYGHCSIFTVPDGVTAIARDAFLGRDALKEVVIPSTVKSIGFCAFPHNLKTIYFKGSKTDWKNIKIDDKINVRIYYYNENSPSKSDDCWRYASDGITPEITNISILSMLGF